MPREINWNACLEELKRILPNVKSELESKVKGYILIEIEEYPPHISINTGKEENPDLVKALEKLPKEYNLRTEFGFYHYGKFMPDVPGSYVLKPDYQKFVI